MRGYMNPKKSIKVIPKQKLKEIVQEASSEIELELKCQQNLQKLKALMAKTYISRLIH